MVCNCFFYYRDVTQLGPALCQWMAPLLNICYEVLYLFIWKATPTVSLFGDRGRSTHELNYVHSVPELSTVCNAIFLCGELAMVRQIILVSHLYNSSIMSYFID